MAHIHGTATAVKSASQAVGVNGMGPMLEHMPAGSMTANMPMRPITLAKGAIVTTTAIRRSFMNLLAKHPLLVFGLGVTAGYLVHKYRKEIIATATRATEKGKDFVLHQKENLEDLVAECKECADDAGETGSA